MNLTYNIRSIPILSKRLYKINIFNNNQNFADVNFMIDKNIVTINNIEIEDIYRRCGYGSLILNNIEIYSKSKYNANYVNLLVWQEYGSTNVCDFFKKNQYIENNINHISTYDDYSKIYELYPFSKKI